jgi:transposase
MGRFDLTDFEWSVIEPLLPTDVRTWSGRTTKIHALVGAEGRRSPSNSPRGRRMTGALPWICPTPFRPGTCSWLSGPMIRMLCAPCSPNAVPGPMLVPAKAGIRPMTGRKRRLPFSRWVYRQRNAVEALLQQIKNSVPSRPDMTSGMINSSPA